MSTEYYKLRKPFTYLYLTREGDRDRLVVWIANFESGTLTIPSRHTKDILRSFFDDYVPVLRTHWGGKDRGAIVTVEEELPNKAVVLSEYGELLTVAQVRARAGATRRDGMPTELFGYEDAPS